MNHDMLMQKCREIARVIEPDIDNEWLDKMIVGYLSGGYIDLGHPDLVIHGPLMNVVMIVIDMMRPIVNQMDVREVIAMNEYLGKIYEKLQTHVARALVYSYQEGLNEKHTRTSV